jgi:glycosyltransferase involved in cell wall biosynthesis
MSRGTRLLRQARTTAPADASRFLVLLPVFNDWECLQSLLPLLDEHLDGASMQADILVIDDGSPTEPPADLVRAPLRAIGRIHLLRLSRNVGHQRAIAIALPFVEANLPHRAVIVMDCDGEDRPGDLVRLIEAHLAEVEPRVLFALRTTRSEGRLFRAFYRLYRLAFRLLVGQDVRIGNFSLIPSRLLERLVSVSEIWNHYSAGVRRSRLPYAALPCPRGVRLAGRSRMNLVSLVTHGLSAMSVYGDVVGTRAVLFFSGLSAVSLLLALAVVVIRLGTTWAIPAWATTAFGLLTVILLQSVTLSASFVFLILASRNQQAFLPCRDYVHFLYEYRLLSGRPAQGAVAPSRIMSVAAAGHVEVPQ